MEKDVPLSRDPVGLAIITALYPATILPLWIMGMFKYGRYDDCGDYGYEHNAKEAEWGMLRTLTIGTLSGFTAIYAFFEGAWLGFSLPQSWWIPGSLVYAILGFRIWKVFSQPLLDWTAHNGS